jgi:ATP-dependent HslUV protease ATP-binding subunit HslU
VGYVGRDVDTIVRDLVEISVKQTREQATKRVRTRAEEAAEERILDVLVGFQEKTSEENPTRQKFRKKLREGELDDKEIEIEVSAVQPQMEILAPPGMEDLTSQIQGMLSNLGGGRKRLRRLKIREALELLTEEEAGRLVNDDELKARAVSNAEQNGIVFLDEIDKITSRSEMQGADVSRQGVQRDLLPLVEGTTVSTRYGMVKTDHILFIASGAFHLAKPSDLIPELQGRFPIRVELESLSVDDFERILVSTDASQVKQYQALLETEKVVVEFRPEAIRRLAEIAYQVNEKTENIGARRLYTVLEKLLEEISFDAGTRGPGNVIIDAKYVDERLGELARDEDLARYVL